MTKRQGARAEREAAALRANLRKRKEQARRRAETPDAPAHQCRDETADRCAADPNNERLPIAR